MPNAKVVQEMASDQVMLEWRTYAKEEWKMNLEAQDRDRPYEESQFRIYSAGAIKSFFSKGVMRHNSFWRKKTMIGMKRMDRRKWVLHQWIGIYKQHRYAVTGIWAKVDTVRIKNKGQVQVKHGLKHKKYSGVGRMYWSQRQFQV